MTERQQTNERSGVGPLTTDEFAEIRLSNVTKQFSDLVAVENANLTVKDGELLVLLGPSGCGKSTTLRMIAGLETPSEGRIKIGNEDVTQTLPQKRDLSMVFQSYALYPHKTVRENLAFPLHKLDISDTERDEKIKQAAELLEIDDQLEKKPGQLSGGQRQRVALGRTIVREPRGFLMDEPLSNLDARLRVQTRAELRRLQQQLGTTTVYVTHDQEEAMSLADRIAVMNNGKIQQVGTPQEVYTNPANKFVAGFVGEPAMNFLDLDTTSIVRESNGQPARAELLEEATVIGIRPEDIGIAEADSRVASDGGVSYELTGEVLVIEPLGNSYEVEFVCGDERITARFRARPTIESGETATMQFPAESIHIFDAEGEVIEQ